ncbi:MAG: V-type ATP synthase subunit D, partial [Clostridia bacterium]|nr:V-type ATP synthase subunit D [Clostridia bacterium]
MARLNVNPTRMELKKLKARLSTAVRGHKLLKDKSDEMIRRFSLLIKENKRLRDEVERELSDCLKQFATARGVSSREELEKAFSMPASSIAADYSTQHIMSVEVPLITVEEKSSDALPYAFAEITSEADYSVEKIGKVIAKLLMLAEVEKSVSMLAVEIERNKRRVNALEYIM